MSLATPGINEMQRFLARFSVSELKKIVSRKIGSFKWENVVKLVDEDGERLTPRTAAKAFVELIKKKKMRDSKVALLTLNIALTDLSFHSTRRLWRPYLMTGNLPDDDPNPAALIDAIKKHYESRMGATLRVLAIIRHDKFWIMVQEKKLPPKRSKKAKNTPQPDQYTKPVFFAKLCREPYIFSPQRAIKEEITETVAHAFGYNSVTAIGLTGYDISDLQRSMKMWEGRAANTALLQRIKFKPEPVEKNSTGGLDLSQRVARKRYAEQLFGDNPPVKKFITFVTKEKNEFLDEHINMRVTLRSPNVWQLMQEMVVEEQGMQVPVPKFYPQAMLKAKDVIKLTTYRTEG